MRNEVHLNQLAIAFMEPGGNCSSAELAAEMAERLNAKGDYFLRTATWNEATVLRISVIAYGTDMAIVDRLARDMIEAWNEMRATVYGESGTDLNSASQA